MEYANRNVDIRIILKVVTPAQAGVYRTGAPGGVVENSWPRFTEAAKFFNKNPKHQKVEEISPSKNYSHPPNNRHPAAIS